VAALIIAAMQRDAALAGHIQDAVGPPCMHCPHALRVTYHRPMSKNDEQRVAVRLAKIMALICVRNSSLEDLHAGQVPTTRTGDYSDVFVVDADGRRIPWPDVSRIDDDEMRALIQATPCTTMDQAIPRRPVRP